MTLRIILIFESILFMWSYVTKRFYSTLQVITQKRNVLEFTNKQGKQEKFKFGATDHFMLAEKEVINVNIKASLTSKEYNEDDHFYSGKVLDPNNTLVGNPGTQYINFVKEEMISKKSDVVIHPHFTDQLKTKNLHKIVDENDKKE